MILKVNLIKPDHLLSISKQINNNIQLTIEKCQTRLPFLVIMINKNGTKIWMDIYQQTNRIKKICPFTSNHSRHSCLKHILFSLARRICIIVENENVKEKRFKELKKNIART